ncbi:MAG TPA: NUDIX hydrolase [Mycobacteriales bacterium]|jgi:8-oxo-dGTP pyrophosphatase MutT (NUDIX family)|nr:NUDIX hydrolase [Mycobacteriales bacterium]
MSEPEGPQGERGTTRADLTEERTERVPVRDAATVVLMRDAPAGPEVYLLRRVRGMAFAAGMTVFPGGAVDPRDADTAVGWTGPPPAEWTMPFDADEALARALLCAAVRETFEESGVLLAGPSAGEVCTTDGPDWEADRVGLEQRDFSLAELLARRALVLRADLLRPWAHWITPPQENVRRRYDTRFFVAALPAGQATRDVTSEADFVEWVRPADALAQQRAGERPMMPPTIVTLEEVADYPSVAAVLAAQRSVSRVQPEVSTIDGRPSVTLPNGRVLRLAQP